MSRSLRTDKTREAYKAFHEAEEKEDICKICEAKSLHEFEHWRIITNDFPYDRISEKHSMLVPKRHAKEIELTDTEKKELFQLKSHDIINEYNYILEATKRRITNVDHYHLNLIQTKIFSL